MLACGEDLGMVPDCLPGVMEHEKILSLKMRGYDGPTRTLSVCATSSHDTATLRMSCPEDPSPETVRGMLAEVLAYPSMLAIFPIQDWLALSGDLRNPDRNERINEPADPHHHWRWRLHLDLFPSSLTLLRPQRSIRPSGNCWRRADGFNPPFRPQKGPYLWTSHQNSIQ